MAQEIVCASFRLEGRVAPETARAIGDRLRLVNSYYSNLIEGHKTTIPEIQSALMNAFAQIYSPGRFHGDERLMAMAASHHRLTWLHPFRDGNGRVARLFSGLFLAALLKAVFVRGAIARGKAVGILNMSERTARRTVSALLSEGLLQSDNHRAPLTIGLLLPVLPYYFPDLYDPVVMGEKHLPCSPHG